MAGKDAVAVEAWGDSEEKALPETKERQVASVMYGDKAFTVKLAAFRASRFGFLMALVVCGTFAWLLVRYVMTIEGEDQVITNAFAKLSESMANTVKQAMKQDLIYQDMVADVWAIKPTISRAEFRQMIMSEAYAPGLETISGMSLIPRVMGAAERTALESGADEERLRAECCANDASTGTTCSTVAATGLFCEGATPSYQITQFSSDELKTADGTSQGYLDRVGQEEYMVVHMIEPFESNSKVWGFNLLSSDARLAAWRKAMESGQKTFTRRLTLVQGDSSEYGVLVWLPMFKKTDGSWTTAFKGPSADLTPVGSVNGVYFLQKMLTKALESTYTKNQMKHIRIYLFDNADELNGKQQFLASYNSPFDFESLKDSSPSTAIQKMATVETMTITLDNTDVKWSMIVAATPEYAAALRTWYPEIALAIGAVVVMLSLTDRLLGHPRLILKSYNVDTQMQGASTMISVLPGQQQP
eukprot:TRINITY_DN101830_c0_g1_i1.p1 TRINITY_DN101830_c0_g1~~TRINITY_DN101830_c0_g1_i1.p1  ORF type:complete len:518 (+),score=122.13 TRINITY_DN101830_c0_g1_i1:137-1555(+)